MESFIIHSKEMDHVWDPRVPFKSNMYDIINICDVLDQMISI